MALTDRALQSKSKPTAKAFKLADSHGLYLLVKPAGGKYWRLDYRLNGKYRTLAFGVYPDVTLREARDKQADARKLLRNGTDPSAVKREHKRQAKAQSEHSFENVAREWHEQQKGLWTADHAHRVLASLGKDIFPHLGAKPIQDITAPVLLQALRRIEKRDALDVAARALQRVSAVFRYAAATGRLRVRQRGRAECKTMIDRGHPHSVVCQCQLLARSRDAVLPASGPTGRGAGVDAPHRRAASGASVDGRAQPA